MKRQALAAMIASLFALAACGGEPAAQAPAETPAASAEAASSAAQATAETPAGELPVIDAVTTHAPEVPPAIDRDYPAKVRVKMETVEKTMKMDDGVEYRYWTFDGDVPGRMIRVREGDTVEVEFSNNLLLPFRTTSTSTPQPVRAAVQPRPLPPRAALPHSASKPCNRACTSTTAPSRRPVCTSPTVCTV